MKTKRCQFTLNKVTRIRKLDRDKCWSRRRDIEVNMYRCWECILVQTSWRTVWHYLVNKLTYSCDHPILQFGIYSNKIPKQIHKLSCIKIFISGGQEFIIKNVGQMWAMYIRLYYTAVRNTHSNMEGSQNSMKQ